MIVAVYIALFFFVIIPTGIPYLQSFAVLKATVNRAAGIEEEEIFVLCQERVAEEEILALGFVRDGAYRVDLHIAQAVFAMWRHGDEPTYLAVYTLGNSPISAQWNIDLVSILSLAPDIGLTTGTTKDGHTEACLPGSYKQSFSDLSLSELWDRHAQAEAYVATKHQIMPQAHTMTGGQMLEYSLRSQARRKLLRPWLALKTPWLFWIGRHRRHNRTVEELNGPLT